MEAATKVMDRAKVVARQVVEGSMNPNDGCSALAELCERNGWPEELVTFSALAHEQAGHEQLGFNRENTAPLIIDACRALLSNGHPS